jgi:hypothetical protein
MSQHPEISYTHVLSELSVNRKDPCEVIRELISNSYDAGATRIEIYPLLKKEGFIFFDNGTGLSETNEIQGITPYKAFFSIGRSTKIQGESIGYKCQGAKLCFASRQFTLITRCKGEESWRSITIDNPKFKLDQKYDISSRKDHSPWDILKTLVGVNDKTRPILERLNEEYFRTYFSSGAMLIVIGLEVEKFSEFYDPNEASKKWSYLKHYIRFNTRHGDVRILRPDETGFPAHKEKSFQQTPGYNDTCKLFLWSNNELPEIPAGYPYVEKLNDREKIQQKDPAEVSNLSAGRFSSRSAVTFQFAGTTYCLALAIDGNRRALDRYKELGRKGHKRSGISLTDQRGTFICSEGVKICQYNEIFEHPKLQQDYAVLGTGSGQCHYIFMINGSFDVVTNRNSLAEDALKTLNDDSFVDKIKEFFDDAKTKVSVFRELIERLNKENQEVKLETYTKKLDKLKEGIKYRPRFMVQDIDQLNGMWLLEPENGEEHWVGALYTMFAHLVHPDSPYAHFWLRPRTFSCLCIDSIAVNCGGKSLEATAHKALEYKYSFSAFDEFNHPLILTEQVVCWEMPEGEEGSQISDSYEYYGYVSLPEDEYLNGLGYKIIKIQGQKNGEYHGGEVKVISLKKLLDKTFKCEWDTPPPPKATDSPKGKKGNKSK